MPFDDDCLSWRRLDDSQVTRLDVHKDDLIKHLESKYGLIVQLLSRQCIGEREMNRLQDTPQRLEANRRLLDLMKRKSKADFNIFIECLEETKQSHLALLLTEDAGNAVAVSGTFTFEAMCMRIVQKYIC